MPFAPSPDDSSIFIGDMFTIPVFGAGLWHCFSHITQNCMGFHGLSWNLMGLKRLEARSLRKHQWSAILETLFGIFREGCYRGQNGRPSGPQILVILSWLVVWLPFFIFPYIGNNPPNWLIFFRGVQTTNQYWLFWVLTIQSLGYHGPWGIMFIHFLIHTQIFGSIRNQT